MKREESFFRQITIEIIAIFIGITLALFIDNYKDNRQSISEIKKHFNLILTEFSKDSIELKEMDSVLEIQINELKHLSIHLKNNDSRSFNQHLNEFGNIRTYNTRIDEINLILNSSAYSQIYNDSIFSHLNDLKSDYKTLNTIQEYEYQSIKNIRNEFVFPNLNINSQSIDVEKISNRNYFFNALKEYQNLLEYKQALIQAILSSSLRNVENIKKLIN